MTLTAIYTDVTIAQWMLTQLGGVGEALNLTVASFDTEEVLRQYGTTDFSLATDIDKLRLVARFVAWSRALDEVAADYNFSEGGASYQRSQMYDMIAKQVDNARGEYPIESATIDYPDNPYTRLNLSDL